MPISTASVGVKRMGDLDHKPFASAAKMKSPIAEAGEKAIESTFLIDSEIQDKLVPLPGHNGWCKH